VGRLDIPGEDAGKTHVAVERRVHDKIDAHRPRDREGLKYASTGWTIHCIFRAVLISGAIIPLQGASTEALLVHFEVTSARRSD